MGMLDRFLGRDPEHATRAAAETVRGLLQQSSGLKVGDLPRFQQRFAARLRELGEPAVDPLIAQFDDASGNPRFLIAQMLAIMSSDQRFSTDTHVRIRDWLIAALKDKDPIVRDVVAMHICRCRDAAVLEPLVRCALGDPSKGTRDIARDSALKFIAELHHLPAEARHDFDPLFQQLRAACADFPEDDITRAVDALASTTTPTSTSARAMEGRSVKQLQGVLIMTPRPLNDAQQLLQQIVDEQKAMGHAAAPGFIATTRVGDAADQQYVYATIRTAFESFGGADVIDRTNVKTFQASDGNSGSYFLLFDRA